MNHNNLTKRQPHAALANSPGGATSRNTAQAQAVLTLNSRTQSWHLLHTLLALMALALLLALPNLAAARPAQPAPDGAAQGAPALSLYGVVLKNAATADFLAAARAAGAKPAKAGADAGKGASTHDASGTGIPALRQFTVLSDGPELITVQFSVDRGAASEMLRKMLVSKYGQPVVTERPSFGAADFTAQYLRDGSFSWTFRDGMRLVYKQPFSGDATLSYTDEPRFQALMARAKAADGQDAASRAAQLKDRF